MLTPPIKTRKAANRHRKEMGDLTQFIWGIPFQRTGLTFPALRKSNFDLVFTDTRLACPTPAMIDMGEAANDNGS